MRLRVAVLLLVGLCGCAKPDLPQTVVRASTAAELAGFRAELGNRFPHDRLASLDTALQELRLDAMNRGVATAEAREQDMLGVVNGKRVPEVEILGWKARCTRLRGEMAMMSGLLDRDLKFQQESAAAGASATVATRIENERNILERLQRDLTDAERQLAVWGATP